MDSGLGDDSVLALVKRRTHRQGLAIVRAADALDESLSSVIQELANCRGHIYTTGVGASGSLSQRLAHLLRFAGLNAMFLQPSEALHGSLGPLREGDILVAMSKGGLSTEVNALCSHAKSRGLTIVSITSGLDTPLSLLSDKVVLFEIDQDDELGGAMATTSGLIQAAIGDAILAGLFFLEPPTTDLLASAHPAGSAGALLREDM